MGLKSLIDKLPPKIRTIANKVVEMPLTIRRDPMNFMSGKKTYMAAGAIVLTSAASYLNGEMGWPQAIMGGLQGLAFIFLRAGVKK